MGRWPKNGLLLSTFSVTNVHVEVGRWSKRVKYCSRTLESGINIPLRLLIFGNFSRGYGLITDLKD